MKLAAGKPFASLYLIAARQSREYSQRYFREPGVAQRLSFVRVPIGKGAKLLACPTPLRWSPGSEVLIYLPGTCPTADERASPSVPIWVRDLLRRKLLSRAEKGSMLNG